MPAPRNPSTLGSEVSNFFSLAHLAPAIEGFRPPSGSFARDGAWTETFGIWTCPHQRAARVGTFTLVRSPQPDGSVRLEATTERNLGPGGRHRTIEVITYRPAPFPVPMRWESRSRGAAPDGCEYPEYRTDLRFEAAGRRFRVWSGGKLFHEADLPEGRPWTCRSLLFECVRRFPARAGWRREFTFIGPGEIVEPGHEIAWRTTGDLHLGGRTRFHYVEAQRLAAGVVFRPAAVPEGGQTVRATAFEHVGPALVPFVYWVDAAGRLLFALSGLEAYVRI